MDKVEKFSDFSKKTTPAKAVKENAPAPAKPVVKPATRPAHAPSRPPRPVVDPRPKAGSPDVAPGKPVVKPATRPAHAPSRPPRPVVTPRPKAVAALISKLLARYNFLLRSSAAIEESIDGKGIPKDALDRIKAGFTRGGMGAVMSHGAAAHGIEQEIKALEKQHTPEDLKDAAMQMVASQFPENGIGLKFSDLNWDVEFISAQEARAHMQKTSAPTRKSKSISVYPDKTKDAIYKKRVMNMVTQGYAVKAQEYFFDANAEKVVDKLAPELVQKYMSFFKHSQKSAEAMPEGEELANLLKSGPPQNFTGSMEIVWNGDDPTIKVRAVNMFFLVHEMTKGVYEMISLHGMETDPKAAQAQVDESDTLFDEMYGFKYGAGLVSQFDAFYEKLENELIRSADIHEHNPSVKPALLQMLYTKSEVGDKQFLSMMELIFKGKPDENTTKKVKALYMRVVETSKQREEDEAEASRVDGINDIDVEGVNIDDLFTGSGAAPQGSNDEEEEDEDGFPVPRSTGNRPAAPAPQEIEYDQDEILDKISAQGEGSLTPGERAFLRSLYERRAVQKFGDFIAEAKQKKTTRDERTVRRVAYLEKKLLRPELPVNERALTEAELLQIKKANK